MEIDFIVKYLSHFEFSRHTTISDVHELARDVLKACVEVTKLSGRELIILIHSWITRLRWWNGSAECLDLTILRQVFESFSRFFENFQIFIKILSLSHAKNEDFGVAWYLRDELVYSFFSIWNLDVSGNSFFKKNDRQTV